MLSLAEALAALPETADGIAAHLTAKGVRGVPGDGCDCPISNYLTAYGFRRVWVTPAWMRAYPEPDVRQTVETPTRIADFVIRFDRGEFPELVLDQNESTTSTSLER